MNSSGIVQGNHSFVAVCHAGYNPDAAHLHSWQRSKAAEELLHRYTPRPKSVPNLSGASCETGHGAAEGVAVLLPTTAYMFRLLLITH